MGRIIALGLLLIITSGCRHSAPDTPLTRAASIGDNFGVEKILAENTDPDICDGTGWAPLHWAARGGHVGAIRILLRTGADPDIKDCAGNNWTPLLHAIHVRQEETARALIDGGSDVNFSSHSRLTPLIMAAGYGQSELVFHLLEKGADPYAEAHDGTNALWAAAGGGTIRNLLFGPKLGTCFPDTIRILCDAAPDLRLRADLSTATVAWLARSDKCSRIVRQLRSDSKSPIKKPDPKKPDPG